MKKIALSDVTKVLKRSIHIIFHSRSLSSLLLVARVNSLQQLIYSPRCPRYRIHPAEIMDYGWRWKYFLIKEFSHHIFVVIEPSSLLLLAQDFLCTFFFYRISDYLKSTFKLMWINSHSSLLMLRAIEINYLQFKSIYTIPEDCNFKRFLLCFIHSHLLHFPPDSITI